VRKAFSGPLVPGRLWWQVVPNYSWRQDVLWIKKLTSSCSA